MQARLVHILRLGLLITCEYIFCIFHEQKEARVWPCRAMVQHCSHVKGSFNRVISSKRIGISYVCLMHWIFHDRHSVRNIRNTRRNFLKVNKVRVGIGAHLYKVRKLNLEAKEPTSANVAFESGKDQQVCLLVWPSGFKVNTWTYFSRAFYR